MPSISINIDIPTLPEGWQGSPDDLLEFIRENSTFSIDGQALSGQIGGARPTQNVGIWFGDTSIEKFVNGKYQPISDVPIGSYFPFAGSVAPVNYLLCDGASYVQTDYPELFSVIGVKYVPTGGNNTTNFNVPDLRGRVPKGAGTGDYSLNLDGSITGSMNPVIDGQYSGLEWLRQQTKPTGFPTVSRIISGTYLLKEFNGLYVDVDQPCIGANYIIRSR